LNTKYEVIINIFTLKNIYESIHQISEIKSEVNWSIKPVNQKKKNFIDAHVHRINVSNIIFINTWLGDNTFENIKSNRILLRIHNINSHFAGVKIKDLQLFNFNIIQNLRYLIIKLKRLGLSRKTGFEDKIFKFIVSENNLKNYLMTTFYVKSEKVDIIPLKIVSHFIPVKVTEPFRILIPGKLRKENKDVYFTENVIKQLTSVGLRNKVEIIITEFDQRFSNYNRKNLTITAIKESLSQQDYEQLVRSCHCIFAPIKLKTHFGIYKEMYGKSKASAIISDVAVNGTPLIIPEGYFSNGGKQIGIIEYKNLNDVINSILKLSADSTYYKHIKAETEKFASETFNESIVLNTIERYLTQ
jgi:hypothetical protein